MDSTPAARADEGYLSSVADRAAMIAVVVLPPIGAFVKWLQPGWVAMMSLLLSPVLVGLWALGLWVFMRALGERSRLRPAGGQVPGLYRRLAWAFAVAMLVPGFVLLDGGDAEPWSSALLSMLGRDESSAGWYHPFQASVLVVAGAVALVAPLVGWAASGRAGQNRR